MSRAAGSQASSPIYIKSHNPLVPKSISARCSRLSFSTHLSKQDFSHSLRTHSRSCRFAPIKAATINNSLYVNTESFYDLLGISENGTVSEIKQAYRQLARKYHPDMSPPNCMEEYTKKFIQVQEAYETLSDPHNRALYDRDMAKSLRLALSGSRPLHHKEGSNERSEWRRRWQSQISELEVRSTNRDLRKNGYSSSSSSWGSRMRAQAAKSHMT